MEFTLLPSELCFSKVNVDSYFEDHILDCTALAIPQSTLLNNNFTVPLVLDMSGISAGSYVVRVEMYEPWGSDEKLNFTQKEITVEYVPQTKESRWVKIPTVKSVASSNLMIVSSSAKNIYREIAQGQKKESVSKRDEW